MRPSAPQPRSRSTSARSPRPTTARWSRSRTFTPPSPAVPDPKPRFLLLDNGEGDGRSAVAPKTGVRSSFFGVSAPGAGNPEDYHPRHVHRALRILVFAAWGLLLNAAGSFPATVKPVLHGKHWVAITGKPLAPTAGALIFQNGGNAVDAACAMLAATSTMWDTLSLGRRDPGADLRPEDREGHRRSTRSASRRRARRRSSSEPQGMRVPAGVRSARRRHARHAGRPPRDARRVRHDDARATCWRRRSQMADGYPIEAAARRTDRARARSGSSSGRTRARVFLTHPGEAREAPQPGEIFRQPDLPRR